MEKVYTSGCIPPLTKEEVFIERGKISVFEKPQRLGQIPNLGELELHGYGFYKINKQA